MRIAIGNSRRQKKWRNIEVTWGEFLNKVATTQRTAEDIEEYSNATKVEQDNIKDVGGFVGGSLLNGNRRINSVEYRSMITLDMDYVKGNLWGLITMLFDFTCCIYSTHKHRANKPRLRLVIPLSRNVTPDEYTAIGRMIAYDIGIDQFDDTTYEPNRLMYWPSTSRNGEYIFKSQKGEFLDPDSILNRYEDWRDSSKWPVSSRQKEIVSKGNGDLEDPLNRKGLVGVFCRTYSIREAIDIFLKDIYKESIIEGRYDYIKASSTAGLIVYEEKFAYSHHATDPASGRLLNAFDLVKIHKFGYLDNRYNEDISDYKKGSYKAMQKFCMDDPRVKEKIVREKICKGKDKLREGDSAWTTLLSIDRNGNIKDELQNLVLIIRNDENLKGIAYNMHRDGMDVISPLPWKQLKCGWTDADMSLLKVYFDKHYNIWSPAKLKEATVAVATERAYHPVKEYLKGLPPWDGVERVDGLLIDYLGAEDNGYSRAVIRKTLVAAVARIYKPGIKFDNILILNGPQGIGKSTFFQKLAHKWFSDSLTITDMRDKSAAEKLQGYWILELGELAGIKRMDVETVKSFITRTDDKYRASYGVNVESHLRQCIIVGTTNSESGFLRDLTGNRRFWPVKVNEACNKKPWQMDNIDQIWAEVLEVYNRGEDLFLKGAEGEIALSEQVEAMECDDREGIVREYLDTLLPTNWASMDLYERRSFLYEEDIEHKNKGTVKHKATCVMEIWCECFGKDAANLRRVDSYEIGAIMSKIKEWESYTGTKNGTQRFPIYSKQRAYERIEKQVHGPM